MKFRNFALTLALIVPLAGCAETAAFFANTATSFSSSSPSDITNLADAIQAADVVTLSANIAVSTGKLDAGTLKEIDVLSTAVHTAIVDLNADHAAGKRLNFSVFRAALDAYNAYATSKGLNH